MEYTLFGLAAILILGFNFFFVLLILCVERKNSALALSWILTLIFLPVIGFFLYLFFGTNVVLHKKKTLKLKQQQDGLYTEATVEKIQRRGMGAAITGCREATDRRCRLFIEMNRRMGHCPCTSYNQVDIIITAQEKYLRLLKDIEAAKVNIHLLYFIIRNDTIGRAIIAALAKKAREGVKVRLLYDHAGCILTPHKTFQPLIECGGEVRRFFPISISNYLRVNFRNHRKIAVIDSRIGYLGGMNIGDEYMGVRPEHSPWRDTHLRMLGECVYFLQLRFIEDWLFSCNYRQVEEFPNLELFFPPVKCEGDLAMQIVSSGPDTKEEEIKWNFIRMITSAQDSVYIQTPYFVPDESFLEAMKIAVTSGVRVVVMIPEKTDNFVVHQVSRSYLGELLSYGVEGYLYPGFLHAKVMIMDDAVTSIGSANMDMRSFSLNFEANAFLYNTDFTKQYLGIFARDMKIARPFTHKEYASRCLGERMLEGIFRLLAPLL